MQKGLNPLFPKSDGKGLKGAYQYSALIDDEKKAYASRKSTSRKSVEYTPVKRDKAGFNANYSQIMANYRQEMRELRQQRKAKILTRKQFRQNQRALAADTNALLRGNLSDFVRKPASIALQTAQTVNVPIEEPKNINLNELSF